MGQMYERAAREMMGHQAARAAAPILKTVADLVMMGMGPKAQEKLEAMAREYRKTASKEGEAAKEARGRSMGDADDSFDGSRFKSAEAQRAYEAMGLHLENAHLADAEDGHGDWVGDGPVEHGTALMSDVVDTLKMNREDLRSYIHDNGLTHPRGRDLDDVSTDYLRGIVDDHAHRGWRAGDNERALAIRAHDEWIANAWKGDDQAIRDSRRSRRFKDIKDAEAEREAAWEEMGQYLEDAWKGGDDAAA